MRYRICLLLALLVAPGVAAQRPTGRAVLAGTVLDAATGRAPLRFRICVSLPDEPLEWQACALVDPASGQYRVDDLPRGRWVVLAGCSTMSIIGRLAAQDTVAVSATAPVRRDWRVSTKGCDPRPLRRVQGMFRGYYTPGFESSEFVPCAADAWFIPGDSLRTKPHDQRSAWARLQEGSLPRPFTWPQAPRDAYGNPRYYVDWRGTVIGPGNYGHMGVSSFEIQVDSVAEIRAPQTGDCQPLR